MNLSPIARRVKIRITSGGSSHSDLDSLLRRFSFDDLAPLVIDGRLSRWLVQIGEPSKSAALQSFLGKEFSSAGAILDLLHVFFDFDNPIELAHRWHEMHLETNLKSLVRPTLLKEDIELALFFAERDFSAAEIVNRTLWETVLPMHDPADSDTALKLVSFLTKLGQNAKAKSILRKFSSEEKVRKLYNKELNSNIINELKYWLTNIRLIHECRPKVRLDDDDSSEFFNSAMFTISQANRNYYSKNADDHGERYRPSILVGTEALNSLQQAQRKERFILVFRLIVALCKMQFFAKQGVLNVGKIPGLELISNQRIEYSATVNAKQKEIKTLEDFCRATFANQIIYIVTETFINNFNFYFDSDE